MKLGEAGHFSDSVQFPQAAKSIPQQSAVLQARLEAVHCPKNPKINGIHPSMNSFESPFDGPSRRFLLRRVPHHWDADSGNDVLPRDSQTRDSHAVKSDHKPGISDRQQREIDRISGTAAPKTLSMPLHILVPLLMEAQEHNAHWLKDFSNDLVQIDSDLHEVLLAYGNLRRARAA